MKEVECQGIWSSWRAAHDFISPKALCAPSLATTLIVPKLFSSLSLWFK